MNVAEVDFLDLSVGGEAVGDGVDIAPSQTKEPFEDSEELAVSNFKPVHGNTGMQKFGGRPKGSENGNKGHLKAWQMGIVDYMLEHPAAKRKQIANHLDVTPEWLSRVMNSDSFLTYQAERIAAHQALVSELITTKASEVALAGLKKLHQRMGTDDIATSDVTKATEMSGKMLGIGLAKAGNTGPTQVNNYGVDAKLLMNARAMMEGAHVSLSDETDPLEGLFEEEGILDAETGSGDGRREALDTPE